MKRTFFLSALILPAALLVAASCRSTPKSEAGPIADSQASISSTENDSTLQHATFAMGCFWHSEEIFSEIRGVKSAVPGYCGGTEPNPSYEMVGSGNTRYAESVEVAFDPKEISYAKLLEVFFAEHDPTTKDRQEPDEGPQYRSAVFYHDANQKAIVETYIKKLTSQHRYEAPIVTELAPFTKFYQAEAYHLRYYRNHHTEPYVVHVVRKEVEKFRRDYPDLLQ